MNLSKAGGNLGIIVALILFSVIIIFHELGHFLLAKKNGIGVTEFALGMGPNLFSIKKGETEYCLKALPIGGLCAMVGEDTDDVSDNSFNVKSVWQRISVVAAGPIFNLLICVCHMYFSPSPTLLLKSLSSGIVAFLSKE